MKTDLNSLYETYITNFAKKRRKIGNLFRI